MAIEWISVAEAAAIVGCHRHTIQRHVDLGRIERRYPLGRKTPTLNRSSVEEFAQWWRAQGREARERRRRECEAMARLGPPDDGEVWLRGTTAALVAGVSAQYLGRLALRGQLPAYREPSGRRWWFRRRDIEQYSAARAFGGDARGASSRRAVLTVTRGGMTQVAKPTHGRAFACTESPWV